MFHTTTIARKQNNKIASIVRDDGSIAQNQTQLKVLAHDYFQDLSTSHSESDEVIRLVDRRISNVDKMALATLFT